jgi:hypothetical protein
VKLLFDENLSRKLVVRLAELYPGSAHVETFDLLAHSDWDIWEFARREGFIIVTADADSYELAATLGPPESGVAPAMDAPDEGRRTRAPARRDTSDRLCRRGRVRHPRARSVDSDLRAARKYLPEGDLNEAALQRRTLRAPGTQHYALIGSSVGSQGGPCDPICKKCSSDEISHRVPYVRTG